MGDPAVATIVEELNEIVRPDGACLRVAASEPSALALKLDLSASECPECVLPKSVILEIVRARVAESCPDVRAVTLEDPREPDHQ